MVRRTATLFLLITVCAAFASALDTDVIKPKSDEITSRLRHGLLRPLLFGNIFGYLLAIKAKIVIVAVAVAIAMAWSAKFWGPGYWAGGCGSSAFAQSESGPWVEEYPAFPSKEYPGKLLEQRSDNNIEVESLTSRVMKGIELANVGYKAITEGEESSECKARLSCEAHQIARESPPLAKMLDIFSSSMQQYDPNVGDDCTRLGCSAKQINSQLEPEQTPDRRNDVTSSTKNPNSPRARKARKFFAGDYL